MKNFCFLPSFHDISTNRLIEMNGINKVYTVTFGDVAENHARMQKIGVLAKNGYSVQQLNSLFHKLSSYGLQCELVDLSQRWVGESKVDDACVLVIRRGVQFILGEEDTSSIMNEHDGLTMDKHALMRGRVVNKRARWNLCFRKKIKNHFIKMERVVLFRTDVFR